MKYLSLILVFMSFVAMGEDDSLFFSCDGMDEQSEQKMSVILSPDNTTASVILNQETKKVMKLLSNNKTFTTEGFVISNKGTKAETTAYVYNSLLIESMLPPKMYVRFSSAWFTQNKKALILGSSVNFSCKLI